MDNSFHTSETNRPPSPQRSDFIITVFLHTWSLDSLARPTRWFVGGEQRRNIYLHKSDEVVDPPRFPVMSAQAQNQALVLEAFDLISSTTILGVFYGVSFTLYCLCARSLYLHLQEVDKQRHARFAIGYISIVFFSRRPIWH